MKARDITEYTKALKMLQEVAGLKKQPDNKTGDQTVNIICGSDGEDYSI